MIFNQKFKQPWHFKWKGRTKFNRWTHDTLKSKLTAKLLQEKHLEYLHTKCIHCIVSMSCLPFSISIDYHHRLFPGKVYIFLISKILDMKSPGRVLHSRKVLGPICESQILAILVHPALVCALYSQHEPAKGLRRCVELIVLCEVLMPGVSITSKVSFFINPDY